MNADELRQKREKLSWSQYQLAKKLGVSRHSVINWENEIIKIPTPVGLALEKVFADEGV